MTLAQQRREWAFFVTGNDLRGKPSKKLTHAEVAETLEISRQRVGQIIAEVKAEREPEVAELLPPWETDKEFLALGNGNPQAEHDEECRRLRQEAEAQVRKATTTKKASKPRKASPLSQYFGLPKDERKARRNALKAKHGIGEHEKNPATGNGWTMKELLAL